MVIGIEMDPRDHYKKDCFYKINISSKFLDRHPFLSLKVFIWSGYTNIFSYLKNSDVSLYYKYIGPDRLNPNVDLFDVGDDIIKKIERNKSINEILC